MGFFNLHVTVVGHASAADISTTTRPFFACPSVPAISTRVWSITRSNPASAAPTGRPESDQAPKKGHRSTPEFWFGSVNPLPGPHSSDSSSEPPTGMRRIAFLPSLISNSSPGFRSSMAVYALPTRRLPLPCTVAV